MPDVRDSTWWLDAKWLVASSAIASFAVVLAYDYRLGIAAGVLLAAAAMVWIGVAIWFALGKRAEPSPVRVLSIRFEEQARRRILAEQRASDGAAIARSRAQQAADRR